jgi:hypothetical protein
VTAPAIARRWELRGHAGPRLAVKDQLALLRRAAPLAALWVTALAAHAGLVPHLAIRGVAPDLLLVAVVAVARGGGARAGAAFGFAAGLGADLFLATPLGTSALACTLVGHAVGGLGSPRPPAPFAGGTSSRPARRLRRAMIRRAAVRRSVLLTGTAVAAGQLGTAMVATALGGLPFPRTAGLLHIAGVAVLSAPLGIPALAAARRFGRRTEARR